MNITDNASAMSVSYNVYFEDVAVDATTCIVLQDVSQLSDRQFARQLLSKIAALSMKFLNCWVIVQGCTDAQSLARWL